jgi:5-methylthioadenosine/S-adenosylhomocysteine deaminase
VDLLIRNARLLAGGHADIGIDGGRFVEPHGVPAEVIDATGLVAAPGFVDGHRHVWQAPLRGLGPDMTLPGYFDAVLSRRPTPEQAHLATLLGAAEALDAGITTVLDFCNVIRSPSHAEAVFDAYGVSGIRAVVGHDHPAASRGRVTQARAFFCTAMGSFDDARGGILLARESGVLATMHAGGGVGQVQALSDAGLLGPHLHLVHLNGLTADEAQLLADSGTGVTITPVVEATMGHGRSPWTTFTEAGGRAGLGTDVAVNAPPDLFEPMRDTLRQHRMATATMHPAADLLATVTIDSARAIGLGDEIGLIEPGRRADLVLLDGLAHLPGDADVTGAVVTCLGVPDVHTVIVDGTVVKRDGRLTVVDLPELRHATRRILSVTS